MAASVGAARARRARRLGGEHAHAAARAQRRAAPAHGRGKARRNRDGASHRALARQAPHPRGVPRSRRIRAESARHRGGESPLLRQAGRARSISRKRRRSCRSRAARRSTIRNVARERLERRRLRVLERMSERGLADEGSHRARSSDADSHSCAVNVRSAPGTSWPRSRAAGSSRGALELRRAAHGRDHARRGPPARGRGGGGALPRNGCARSGRAPPRWSCSTTRRGDVLAYVGAPDFHDEKALGQNDGVRALRQPGSTLKPFVYAAAMRGARAHGRVALARRRAALPSEKGVFSPEELRPPQRTGPCSCAKRSRARSTFRRSSSPIDSGSSACSCAARDRLRVARARRRATTASRSRSATARFACSSSPARTRCSLGAARWFASACSARAVDAAGSERPFPPSRPERVLDARVAAVVTDILADPAARASAFGRDNVLELALPGRGEDRHVEGLSRQLDGRVHARGHRRGLGRQLRRLADGWLDRGDGAAPLFRDVMIAAMAGREPLPLVDRSGARRNPGVRSEWRACRVPTARTIATSSSRKAASRTNRCSMHERVAIDPENGLRAGSAAALPKSGDSSTTPEFAAWATEAGRPLAPTAFSPRCPGRREGKREAPSIAFPVERGELPPRSGLSAARDRARGASRSEDSAVRFVLNGRPVGSVRSPFRVAWALERGAHRLEAFVGDRRSEPVRFDVEYGPRQPWAPSALARFDVLVAHAEHEKIARLGVARDPAQALGAVGRKLGAARRARWRAGRSAGCRRRAAPCGWPTQRAPSRAGSRGCRGFRVTSSASMGTSESNG